MSATLMPRILPLLSFLPWATVLHSMQHSMHADAALSMPSEVWMHVQLPLLG